MPLLIKLRKLVYKYTSDIDMTGVNKARTKISELSQAKEQLIRQLDEVNKNEERLSIINRINSLTEKINIYETELECDTELVNKQQLYNECSSMAVIELFGDEELITGAMDALLDPAPCFSCNDHSAVKFIAEVLTGFFLHTGMQCKK
jgi:hypothetical protein